MLNLKNARQRLPLTVVKSVAVCLALQIASFYPHILLLLHCRQEAMSSRPTSVLYAAVQRSVVQVSPYAVLAAMKIADIGTHKVVWSADKRDCTATRMSLVRSSDCTCGEKKRGRDVGP